MTLLGGSVWADEPASRRTPAPSVTLPAAPAAGSVREREDPRAAIDEAADEARRWIAKGEPAKALAALRRAMRSARAEGGVDTTDIRFMAAQALLAMRRYGPAAAILGRLAEERPETHRIRLDYAAALFALGRDDEAEALFREVWRREDLPPAVRRNVERFLEDLRARQRLQIDFDAGLWSDDNVNNAPEIETVEVPWLGGHDFTVEERPVRAWVARSGARLRWRRPVTERGGASIETRAALARNTALNASAYNRTWASLSAGPRVRYAANIAGRRRPGVLRADAGAERRWRGGDGYALSLWGGLGLEQAIPGDLRLALSTRQWSTRYDQGERERDPRGRSLGLQVTRRVGPGHLIAGGTFSRETPERRDLRWTSREASLGYVAELGRGFRLSLRVHRIGTRFAGEHPWFRKRRKERTRGLGVTISHRSITWKGYLPELSLDWTQTRSNIPLYDRQSRTLRLGLRRLF